MAAQTNAERDARDGTSQATRTLPALAPDRVSLDERTLEDMLLFLQHYGAALTFYDLNECNGESQETWSALLGGDPSKPEERSEAAVRRKRLVAFLREPGKFSPDNPAHAWLFRPHVTLLLVFLKLREQVLAEFNGLTARHLEFYYQSVLRLQRQPAIADHVHLVARLTAAAPSALLPKETQLIAGSDVLGRPRIYATDSDLVVSRSQVAKVSSLRVDRRRIGLRQVPSLFPNSAEECFLKMLEMALGKSQSTFPLFTSGAGYAKTLANRLGLASSDYFLPLPQLRELILRVERRPAQDGELWMQIHELIDKAGGKRSPGTYTPCVKESRNLEADLARAVGMPNDVLDFSSLDGISSLDDLYDLRELRESDVESFVENRLYMSMSEFEGLMSTKRKFDREWAMINQILARACLRRTKALTKWQPTKVDDFNGNLRDTIDKSYRQLDAYWQELTSIEQTPIESQSTGLDVPVEQLLGFVAPLAKDPPDAPDWVQFAAILEAAYKKRLGELGREFAPIPEEVTFFNLYPADDATQVHSARLIDKDAPSWLPFGLPGPSHDPFLIREPVLGWALSSPLLAMEEGERDITLTLGFSEQIALSGLKELFANLAKCPLSFAVSTSTGWLSCIPRDLRVDSYDVLLGHPTGTSNLHGLMVRLRVARGASAIRPVGGAGAEPRSPWPSLRVMLQPQWNEGEQQHVVRYPELSHLMLVATHLAVKVSGLTSLALHNDESAIDSKKPFEPFGFAPTVGSRFRIGHPELVTKPLDSVTFHAEWLGVPKDLQKHYANYELSSTDFAAEISMVDRSLQRSVGQRSLLFGQEPIPLSKPGGPADPFLLLAPWLEQDLSGWPRYLQWQLSEPDFQHGTYAPLATKKTMELASAIANQERVTAADYLVNPPYTPKLKSLSVDYKASVERRFDRRSQVDQPERIFHLHPFGYADLQHECSSAGVPFLPRYDYDGELYIGLSDVVPPQSVALLIQVQEGSANPDLPPPQIDWSYLSNNRWLPLGQHVLSDSTQGLIKSGIVVLSLPKAEPSTRHREPLYFVRAAVAKNPASIPEIIGIHTQSVRATLISRDNAPEHFAQPLPAGTIGKLSTAREGIAGIQQPYPSFGGRPSEAGDRWNTRISERLRHKQRSLTTWDYERLILEQFPHIYKAKCLPAEASDPGKVGIIVIPDLRGRRLFDPFAPKAPASLLADIQTYLRERTPASITLEVRNAHFIKVLVRVAVGFSVVGNDEFYKHRLLDELNRFLSPWAYEEGADIAICGRIHASRLIDFIERRDYVDYVARLRLFVSIDGENYQPVELPTDKDDPNGYSVAASRPDGVLVTGQDHQIDVLSSDVYDEPQQTGINFMRLGLDFIVDAARPLR